MRKCVLHWSVLVSASLKTRQTSWKSRSRELLNDLFSIISQKKLFLIIVICLIVPKNMHARFQLGCQRNDLSFGPLNFTVYNYSMSFTSIIEYGLSFDIIIRFLDASIENWYCFQNSLSDPEIDLKFNTIFRLCFYDNFSKLQNSIYLPSSLVS